MKCSPLTLEKANVGEAHAKGRLYHLSRQTEEKGGNDTTVEKTNIGKAHTNDAVCQLFNNQKQTKH